MFVDLNHLGIRDLAFKFDIDVDSVRRLADQSALLPDSAQRFFHTNAENQGKARWAEKTPRNVHRIDYLLDIFPDATFIHVIRDGRDVACSLRTHPKY